VVPVAVTVGRPFATVGETLGDLMAARGWPGAADWARRADRIAPTIVGGPRSTAAPTGTDPGQARLAELAWTASG